MAFSSFLCQGLFLPLSNALVRNALSPGPASRPSRSETHNTGSNSNPCILQREGRVCVDQRIFVQLPEAIVKESIFAAMHCHHRRS